MNKRKKKQRERFEKLIDEKLEQLKNNEFDDCYCGKKLAEEIKKEFGH